MSIKLALAGNPNCGKTTMFNDLTGSQQYVGNWPGVTVEKKEGKLKGHKDVIIQDLPGIYSLSPYTLEEVVARNYLINERPDAIINITDATNIERNLYLTTQLLEIGLPVVMALNMMDIVRKNGDVIDVKKLSHELGCEVIETSALKGEGSKEVALECVKAAQEKRQCELPHVFRGAVEHAIAHIEDIIDGKVDAQQKRWFAIKLFERDSRIQEQLKLSADDKAKIEESIVVCEKEYDDDSESIVTNERYAYISKIMETCVKKKSRREHLSVSDKIDKVLTHRVWALPIFALIMIGVYYVAITSVGSLVTDWTNDTLFGEWIVPAVNDGLVAAGAADWVVSLLADGIVGGVGAVIGFVPQMLVLFILLGILEECGYMARVAFIMDRIFRRFGLSGKSFIPMLVGSGCGVPGIMASRTIENERDRRMTIITTTFIPCGAKMPIIGLIAGALFSNAWWVAPLAYFIGVAAIVVSGVILKKFKMFSGEPAPFVMELPAYHVPTVGSVLRRMWERGWSFIKRAGTIIVAASVIIWFLSGFGFDATGAFVMVDDINTSILANVCGAIAGIFDPLGFGNWQSTTATIMGLVAKEEVVGVFGTLYGVAGDAMEMVDEGAFAGLAPIAANFTALSALSFMIFNLLCAPCFAAMGAIKREMNSGKWTAFAIAYQCIFAYVSALIVYQLGLLFTQGIFSGWTVVAIVLLILVIYLMARKYKESDKLDIKVKLEKKKA